LVDNSFNKAGEIMWYLVTRDILQQMSDSPSKVGEFGESGFTVSKKLNGIGSILGKSVEEVIDEPIMLSKILEEWMANVILSLGFSDSRERASKPCIDELAVVGHMEQSLLIPLVFFLFRAEEKEVEVGWGEIKEDRIENIGCGEVVKFFLE
jgi:hypothetical protein